MNRMMMLTLIALTVSALSYVSVGEATTGQTEPAVPAVTDGTGLDSASTPSIDARTMKDEASPTPVDTSSTEIGEASFEFGPKLPLPTDCTPGISCNSESDCGWDPGSGCPLGQCVGNTCYCY